MASTPDKEKAVASAMTQIERQFGKGSIMKLGDTAVENIPYIPSAGIVHDPDGSGRYRCNKSNCCQQKDCLLHFYLLENETSQEGS